MRLALARQSLIPAGEMWFTGELRPSLEDWIGAGKLLQSLCNSGSGKELIERGFGLDVELAGAECESECSPTGQSSFCKPGVAADVVANSSHFL